MYCGVNVPATVTRTSPTSRRMICSVMLVLAALMLVDAADAAETSAGVASAAASPVFTSALQSMVYVAPPAKRMFVVWEIAPAVRLSHRNASTNQEPTGSVMEPVVGNHGCAVLTFWPPASSASSSL